MRTTACLWKNRSINTCHKTCEPLIETRSHGHKVGTVNGYLTTLHQPANRGKVVVRETEDVAEMAKIAISASPSERHRRVPDLLRKG